MIPGGGGEGGQPRPIPPLTTPDFPSISSPTAQVPGVGFETPPSAGVSRFSFLSFSFLLSQASRCGASNLQPAEVSRFPFLSFSFITFRASRCGASKLRPLKFPVFHFSAFHYSDPQTPVPERRISVCRSFPFPIPQLLIPRSLLSRTTVDNFPRSGVCCPRNSFPQISLCCIQVIRFSWTLVPISGGLSARDARSCLFLLCCSAIPLVHTSEARCSHVQLLVSRLLREHLFELFISCLPGLSVQQFCGSQN